MDEVHRDLVQYLGASHPTTLTLARRVVLLWHLAGPHDPRAPDMGLIGTSDGLRAVRQDIARVAAIDDVPVLVRGESGVGGRYLAYGDLAGRVRARDLDTGRIPIASDTGAKVSSLVFSPDGAWLAVGDADGGLRRWPASAWTGEPSAGTASAWSRGRFTDPRE